MSQLLFPAPLGRRPCQCAVDRSVFPIRRIFCVGRNYEAHAKEMGVAVDREAPFYFTKAAEHYVPSGSTVPYPPGTSNYHYETGAGRGDWRSGIPRAGRPRARAACSATPADWT